MTRPIELAKRAWSFALDALSRPRELPGTVAALARGVNPGQYLKLNWPWLRQSGIRTVIDVGAHKGEFSSAIRVLVPESRIYAFEPLPDCCSVLSRKLGSNGHAKIFPVVVGRDSGTATLWRSSYAKSSSVLPMAKLHKDSFPWTAQTEPLTVPMKSLDEFNSEMKLEPKVLLKIDVQGYEAEVLRGATALLQKTDYVLLEVSFRTLYEGQGSFAEIHAILEKAGFAYSGNLEQLLSPRDGSILQADALFLRTLQ